MSKERQRELDEEKEQFDREVAHLNNTEIEKKLTVRELIKLLQEMDTQDELVLNLGTGVYVSYVVSDIDVNEIVIT